jgi:hypothetical protein
VSIATFGVGNGRVAAGFVYGQTTQTPQWRFCYTQAIMHSAGRVVCEIGREASGVHIPDARSKIVSEFLKHPAGIDWLWMVDTDATFGPDVIERLVAVAHPKTAPIVGALAFAVKPRTEQANECFATPLEGIPTLFRFTETGVVALTDYPRDELVPVHSTGAHCILIHRSVLADKRWLDGHPSPWYRTAVRNGAVVSEDQFFCLKAGSLGYPIFVDTSIKTGHVKTFVADEDWYLSTLEAR